MILPPRLGLVPCISIFTAESAVPEPATNLQIQGGNSLCLNALKKR